MFSLEQIKFFNEKGYLVIKKFFSKKEIKALQLEVKRIKDEGFCRNVATDGNGKTAGVKPTGWFNDPSGTILLKTNFTYLRNKPFKINKLNSERDVNFVISI